MLRQLWWRKIMASLRFLVKIEGSYWKVLILRIRSRPYVFEWTAGWLILPKTLDAEEVVFGISLFRLSISAFADWFLLILLA